MSNWTCAQCEAVIVGKPDHVFTRDGVPAVTRAFCSPRCRADWLDGKPSPGSREWWRAVAQGLGAEVGRLRGALEAVAESATERDCVDGQGQEECIDIASRALKMSAAGASYGVKPIEDHSIGLYRPKLEARLRHAWDTGFRLAVAYGDNHAHLDGEQRERQWRYFVRAYPVTSTEDEQAQEVQ